MNRLSPAEPSVPFTSALLLVRHEDLAVVDRRALRDAGIRSVRVLSSGVEAARILHASVSGAASQGVVRRDDPDLVFCHEQLPDMTGDEFVRLIRLHPALLPFPIVMAVASDTSAVRAKATESGYSGLLTRPYPQTALLAQLLRAAACRDATRDALRASTNADTSAFEAALAYFLSQDAAHSQDADKVYRSGLLALRQQQWDEAVSTLQRASRLDPDSGKTLLALAVAWRGKGNRDKSSAMLQEAVAVFVKNRDWAQAVAVSQRLLRENPGIPHPLQGEARRLVAAGNMQDATQVLLCDESALEPRTGKRGLYEQLCRGCCATADPEHAASELCACLTVAGYAALGTALQAFVSERLAQPSDCASDLSGMSGMSAALPDDRPDVRPDDRPDARLSGDSVPHSVHTEAALPKSGFSLRKKRVPLVTPQAIALLTEPSTPSALKGFPRLRDALAVARVTLGLFNARKKTP